MSTSNVFDPRTLVVDRSNRFGGVVHHHHDADTVYCTVWSPLLQVYVVVGVRVRGVQCPELADPGGREVAAAVAREWPAGTAAVVSEVGPYPRPGHVTARLALGGVDVTGWLLVRGFAVPYDGTGPRPSVPWPPPV